jgi:hypothetical protein
MVADQALDLSALMEALHQKWRRQKRTVVRFWREEKGLSERRACSLIGLDRSTHC